MSHHTRPRTRLNPEIRREQIVDAAERVFVGRDPAEVTFEEIAEAAGVSRGLVYNYFGDKQGLVAAVYVRGMDRLDRRLAEAVEGVEHGEERIRRVVREYVAFARDSARGFSSMVGSNTALSHPDAKEARRRRVERLAERWFSGDAAAVLAAGVVGLLEGVALGWLEDDGVPVDEVAARVAALLWRGLEGMEASGGAPVATAVNS